MASGGILSAGVSVSRGVASTTLFLDSMDAPVLNVQHQGAAGQISLSAGSNPSQGFTVAPVAIGNSQILTGPNALVSNTLTVGQQLNLNNAAVSNVLTVGGYANVYGSFLANSSATIANTLVVGNAVQVPSLVGNAISTSTLSATGPLSNAYIETFSSSASNNAALYLSSSWRLKVTAQNGLGFQNKYNGTWQNVQVVQPLGFVGSIGSLVSSII